MVRKLFKSTQFPIKVVLEELPNKRVGEVIP